jgi:hypothetical protein
MIGLPPGGDKQWDWPKPVACVPSAERSAARRAEDQQARIQRLLAVDATATPMFSVRSGSGAKVEALIASMLCDHAPKEFG